jgi:copper chaperone CopZ
METLELLVKNIKCGGCMSGIKNALLAFPGVKSVEINIEEEKITIQGEKLDRTAYLKKVDGMGYPEKGNNTLLKEAKSYVSCAIGKVTA